jgi:rare lipoprotein A
MKLLNASFLFLFMAALCGPYFAEAQVPGTDVFRQEGIASWYGAEFDGRPTASGEIFNSALYTAAHPTLPFGTVLMVTNRHNNRQVAVKVNDRGPFVAARIIDMSRAAAEQLDMLITGTAPVLIEVMSGVALPSATGTAAPQVSIQPSAPPVPPPMQTMPPIQTIPSVPVSSPLAVQPVPQTPPMPVYQPPVSGARLSPVITLLPNKIYKLQVGSYKEPKNAVDAFEKLKNVGLNPSYERSGDFFRVVLAGVQGTEVQSIANRLESAGFREALIREN